MTYRGKNVYDVLDMTVDEALEFSQNLPGLARKLKRCTIGLGYIRWVNLPPRFRAARLSA